MPPRKKPLNQQQSVKDLLQKKQAEKVRELQAQATNVAQAKSDEGDSIHLPHFFSKYTEILPVTPTEDNVRADQSYHCSTMARVWFRQHSNLDEILQAHMKKVVVMDHPIESYTSAIIRAVTSAPLRKYDGPYCRFRFDSPANEIIGRTLLTNPRIRTEPDLEEFIKFQNKHQLKLLEIPLYVNNTAHEDAIKYIEDKKKLAKTDVCPNFTNSSLFNSILRKYYEREDLMQDIFIQNITVEQLESISNFRKVCLKLMEKEPENVSYEMFALLLLESFQTVPGASHIHPQFAAHPQYNLICNIMTVEQQHAVADSYRWFYDRTNAGKIHKRLQDGSTREEFHRRYRVRDDYERKMPPFHNMYYVGSDDEEGDAEDPEPQVTYANTRERFVRNDELPAAIVEVDEEINSETSRDTVVPQPELTLPENFIRDPKPAPEEYVFMKLLMQEKRFIFQVKQELSKAYKNDFNALWLKHKAFILMNFIHRHWENDLEQMMPFIEKCSPDTIAKFKEIIASRKIPKTPEAEETVQENRSDESSEVIMSSPGTVPLPEVPSTVIKHEQLSPHEPQHFTDSSEVQCCGTLIEPAIVLNDSQDAETSLLESLQAQDEDNPFLKEINQETQPDLGNETLARLREFEPLSVQHLREDRKHLQEASSNIQKRKSPRSTDRPGPKSKKRQTRSSAKSKPNIEYLDDDSEPQGNEFPPPPPQPIVEDVLNDDFSVFLSSQLMSVEAEISTTPLESLPFTFTKPATVPGQREIPRDTTCFIVQLQRVIFERHVKFELHVNLQQYSIYNIVINNDSIQSLLNISDLEFSSVLNLLDIVERYDYTVGETQRGKLNDSGNSYITHQLDLFFSTQIRFKNFQLHVEGDNFTCVDGNYTTNTNTDLTSSIPPEILRNLRRN